MMDSAYKMTSPMLQCRGPLNSSGALRYTNFSAGATIFLKNIDFNADVSKNVSKEYSKDLPLDSRILRKFGGL